MRARVSPCGKPREVRGERHGGKPYALIHGRPLTYRRYRSASAPPHSTRKTDSPGETEWPQDSCRRSGESLPVIIKASRPGGRARIGTGRGTGLSEPELTRRASPQSKAASSKKSRLFSSSRQMKIISLSFLGQSHLIPELRLLTFSSKERAGNISEPR